MPTSKAIPTTAASKLALEELEFFSEELTILGVYPAHPFREEEVVAAVTEGHLPG